MTAHLLSTHRLHLGLGATAVALPEFTGTMDWYQAYGERHAADGPEGRLVSLHTFTEPWASWEMHPQGHEVVICTAGRLTLHQQGASGDLVSVTLDAGQYAINLPAVWHTADVEPGGQATARFITAGAGTQHRAR